MREDERTLLEDAAFARRLARSLVEEASLADDVSQEAWSEMLRRPPPHNRRGYLSTIVRRVAGKIERSEKSRRRRERSAAKDEALPSEAELVARAEVHRRVVQAVLEIDEPYRSTLLLHYFEDVSARDIALRLGLPLETIRTRLKRGRVRVREQLEARWPKSSGTWVSALALFAGTRPPTNESLALPGATRIGATRTDAPRIGATRIGATRIGATRIGARIGAALFVVGLLGVGAVWLLRDRANAAEASTAHLATTDDVRRRAARPGAPLDTRGAEARLAATPDDESVTETALEVSRLHGRIVDAEGAPIAGAELVVWFLTSLEGVETARARSAEDGSYACPLPELDALSPAARRLTDITVRVDAAGYAPEYEWLEKGSAHQRDIEHDVELRPGWTVSGRVVDTDGRPLDFASISVAFADESSTRNHSGPTDADGTFRFPLQTGETVRAIESSKRRVGVAYHEPSTLADRPADIDIGDVIGDIVLRRLGVLSGRVVYPDGSPTGHMTVSARLAEPLDGSPLFRISKAARTGLDGYARGHTRADARGHFELLGLREGPYFVDSDTFFGRSFDGVTFQASQIKRPGEAIELVAQKHRLLVSVQDPSGQYLSGASVACTVLESKKRHVNFTRGDEQMATFTVKAGDTVALYAHVEGTGTVEARVTVPAQPFETRHALMFPKDAATGDVVLHLLGDAPAFGELALSLRTEHSNLPVFGAERRAVAADGLVRGLPVGTYRAVLEPLEGTAAHGCFLETELEALIEVHANVTAELACRLAVGGDVQVKLTGHDGETGSACGIYDFGKHEGAWIPPGFEVGRLAFFRWDQESATFASSPTLEELNPNETTDVRLPEGRYTVRATMQGFESAEGLLDVRACARDELGLVLNKLP